MNLMYISLSLTVGFVIGAIIAYVFVTRFSSKHKIQDELLRSKRELANAKRQLDEFFVGGDELFSQLTKAYSTYARYMEEAAKRLSPDNSDLYRIENSTASGEEVRKSLKESLMALKEQVSDITATIEEEEKKEKGETVSEEESAVKSEKKADRKAEKADEPSSEENPAPKEKVKEEPVAEEKSEPKPVEPEDGAPETKSAAKPKEKEREEAPLPPAELEEIPQPPKDFVERREPEKI